MSNPERAPLEVGVPDTGDLIDPTVPDPTGDEVSDHSDESYVDPAVEADPAVAAEPEG